MLFVATGGAAVVPPTRADSVPTFVQFPLECGVLEILLSTAVGMMAAELEEMDRTVEAFNVACLEHHPKPRTLHDLHELKEPVDGFMDRLANTGKVLEQLLNSSEDMRGMELTRLYYSLLPDEATERDEDDYNPNLEIMFEYFDQELDQMTQRASKVQRVLANAERHINLKLSLMRSKFHIFDIISGILGVGIAAGNGISGIFGMNLRSDLENSKTSFLLSVSAIVLLAATSVLIAWYFRARYV
ncbi:putative Mg2+ transporter [Gregarina niphandrodes]|uniref:Mg2+ transporter n=1 Tax=Gregarina niphandrodes TaxID=110365 RepID=A0A023AYP5_GRENI|nr:putative Mg2+ transporter [Gregarina niphandrodes]EZG43786.1 putative Mg2+ transporter [Gregarina niphandrodes]|eukprot:XP_011134601.1 putative Mg2+ transporter [Gregarina niphandrodes]